MKCNKKKPSTFPCTGLLHAVKPSGARFSGKSRFMLSELSIDLPSLQAPELQPLPSQINVPDASHTPTPEKPHDTKV